MVENFAVPAPAYAPYNMTVSSARRFIRESSFTLAVSNIPLLSEPRVMILSINDAAERVRETMEVQWFNDL